MLLTGCSVGCEEKMFVDPKALDGADCAGCDANMPPPGCSLGCEENEVEPAPNPPKEGVDEAAPKAGADGVPPKEGVEEVPPKAGADEVAPKELAAKGLLSDPKPVLKEKPCWLGAAELAPGKLWLWLCPKLKPEDREEKAPPGAACALSPEVVGVAERIRRLGFRMSLILSTVSAMGVAAEAGPMLNRSTLGGPLDTVEGVCKAERREGGV